MTTQNSPCPCSSEKKYSDCCAPFHSGEKKPATAVELMRSRFSAYSLHLYDYIIQSTHMDSPHRLENTDRWKREIESFCQCTSFQKLTIQQEFETGEKAYVVFTAYLLQGEHDTTFTEKSRFEKIDDEWLYLEGETLPGFVDSLSFH